MRYVEFIIAVFATIASFAMLVSAFITDSPVKCMSITVFTIIFMLCILSVRITYNEVFHDF